MNYDPLNAIQVSNNVVLVVSNFNLSLRFEYSVTPGTASGTGRTELELSTVVPSYATNSSISEAVPQALVLE